MASCYKKYSRSECDATEKARIRMNLDQARKHHNYTKIGFLKMRAPEATWKPVIDFYNINKGSEKPEEWPPGNTYVNHWSAQTTMVSLEDNRLRGSGGVLKKQVWDGVRPIIEEWTGKKLKETSMYGIRVYKEGAVLATHLDRLPLVSSCIINVDQDVDEPWPLEVYDHNGRAHNITMVPGDMVLYEVTTNVNVTWSYRSHKCNLLVHVVSHCAPRAALPAEREVSGQSFCALYPRRPRGDECYG
jgi:hypothetical protein